MNPWLSFYFVVGLIFAIYVFIHSGVRSHSLLSTISYTLMVVLIAWVWPYFIILGIVQAFSQKGDSDV